MTAVVDRGTIRTELDKFSLAWRERINGWRESGAGHTEKSYAQQYWSDLLRCFGVIPERIDLFERDATRASSGRTGYVDLFWSGVVLGEAKSLGRDLDSAYTQALDYLSGGSIGQHEWPRYVIVSDFENLQVTKLGEDSWTVRFTIDQVVGHIDQLMFLAGQETITKAEEEEASAHAAALMADLYTAMIGDDTADEQVGDDAPTNPEDEDVQVQRTSIFLTRILFLLYGDDAGLWEEDLFYRFVLYDTTGENLGARLNTLFQVLNTPVSRRRRVPVELERFPYVNGSLFAVHQEQEFLDADMREALLAACRFHWTRISPAVFGSMFQLVKSKEARRADGEHYTSESNILKVIEPLFLDELREKASRLIRNKTTKAKELRDLRDEIAQMRFLDPACGCGNFLVVAYRELRAIETSIIVALREKEHQATASMDVSLDQRMNIGQFYGFELNWWPAKIAETAMFLVDHQANRALAAAIGDAPERLPISITAHINHGNALALDWAQQVPAGAGSTYVFGNPPFIGQYTKTSEQTADMKAAWGEDYDGYLDYVTAWHAKTADLLADRHGEFAYVTTNSITQGQPVPALFGPLYRAGWNIKFAHRTFSWDSEAPGKAAVHCVIVGFTRTPVVPRYTEALRAPEVVRQRLWDYDRQRGEPAEVPLSVGINAYLVDGPKTLVKKSSKPVSPELPFVTKGSQPTDGGHLVFKATDGAQGLDQDPIAAKYLRQFVGAKEMLNNTERWCLWLPALASEDIRASAGLRSHLEAVRAVREASTKKATQEAAETPALFTEIRQPDVPYLAIPRHVSESRRFWTAARYEPDVICGDANFLAPDEDGLLFALISSSMFITWQRAVGGRIKSDLRFSNTLTWNTFPVPSLDEATKRKIITAGQGVLEARSLHPERSLADAYNPLNTDPALVKAHKKLDRAVDMAFGAERLLSDDRQRLEILFRRYTEMTAGNV
ncbi:DNA methyltransferase [Corynebacterium sputi]|uniref:DNA methyltransferase n=1 Tax=Corynebacterium sputi TaxID=489915 RepID=UPI0003F780B5